jgi:glycosyltransferase involved in cell wall biosynthesis
MENLMTSRDKQSWSGADVSVIIPIHNSVSTLLRALESVAMQTEMVAEVIVVNDRSTDDFEQVLNEFEQPFGLRVVPSSSAGAGAARNTGIACASGDMIAFLDADDVWYPEKIAMQLPLMQDGTVIVGSLMHYVTPSGRILAANDRWKTDAEATRALRSAEAMPLALSSFLVRKTDVLAAKGFDETFLRAQDFEFAVRLLALGGRITWPERVPLLAYTLSSSSVSARTYKEQFLAADLVRMRTRSTGNNPDYSDYVSMTHLPLGVRRRIRSGDLYRNAGAAFGESRIFEACGRLALASIFAPKAVAIKLIWQGRQKFTRHASLPKDVEELYEKLSETGLASPHSSGQVKP